MIKQLCNSDAFLPIPFGPYGIFRFSIDYLEKELPANEALLQSIRNRKINNIKNPRKFLESNLIKIELKNVIPPSVVPDKIKREWSEIDLNLFDNISTLEFNKAMIYEYFNKRIHDLIFVANISDFGSLTVQEYIIFQNKEVYVIGGGKIDYKPFYEAKKKRDDWDYPNLIEIKITKAWEWLIQREDFLQGFSQTATARALINLAEISHSDNNMKLFRAVMGIEALYTKGKSSLIEQVREKTQVILGPQEKFKKLYSSMYNFRSQYIHGELNFPSQVSIDFSKRNTNYTEELITSTYFAVLILGATIQQLIIRDWEGLDFTYEVQNLLGK